MRWQRRQFTQHEELITLLLSTGDSKLVEHTENDDYWGDGGDGSGKNMLGRILMQVRESLRLSQDFPALTSSVDSEHKP
jgi:N-glycosidase YbiA